MFVLDCSNEVMIVAIDWDKYRLHLSNGIYFLIEIGSFSQQFLGQCMYWLRRIFLYVVHITQYVLYVVCTLYMYCAIVVVLSGTCRKSKNCEIWWRFFKRDPLLSLGMMPGIAFLRFLAANSFMRRQFSLLLWHRSKRRLLAIFCLLP